MSHGCAATRAQASGGTASSGGVEVRFRRRLPTPDSIDREAPLDQGSEPGTFEQSLRDLGGTVAQRRPPHPGVSEHPDAFADVLMDVEFVKRGEYVLGRLRRIPAQRLDLGEAAAEGRRARRCKSRRTRARR
jgi:hypothetical protein